MAQISLKETLAKILNTPMIVEQGTSGMWTYRKWSDGTEECWGITPSASHAMTQPSGNGYWVAENYSLPSGVFININNVQANRSYGNGLVFISVYGVSTTNISCYVCCTAILTISFGIFFSVKGRWK